MNHQRLLRNLRECVAQVRVEQNLQAAAQRLDARSLAAWHVAPQLRRHPPRIGVTENLQRDEAPDRALVIGRQIPCKRLEHMRFHAMCPVVTAGKTGRRCQQRHAPDLPRRGLRPGHRNERAERPPDDMA